MTWREETIGAARLILGDCREILPTLGKVDLLCTDPPYGTTQNNWDKMMPLSEMWRAISAVSDRATVQIFTAAEPFMSELVCSNRRAFKYDMVWLKTQAVGHLNARIMPMRNHENIAVFCQGRTTYNPQLQRKNPDNIRPVGKRAASENYGSFGEYADRTIPENMRYPQSVEIFANVNVDELAGHPTQKPVSLFSYLVRQYSNPGQLVCDPFMGSGTTGVAAVMAGRRFVGIEQNETYFELACKRITDAQRQGQLFGEAA